MEIVKRFFFQFLNTFQNLISYLQSYLFLQHSVYFVEGISNGCFKDFKFNNFHKRMCVVALVHAVMIISDLTFFLIDDNIY